MRKEIAITLNNVNKQFYQLQAESFSSTRHASWGGWTKALDMCDFSQAPSSVLDVACGNMRFEKCLAERYPGASIECAAFDSCNQLAELSVASDDIKIRFDQVDIVSKLVEGLPLAFPKTDLVVSFGFAHHVPGYEQRVSLMKGLWEAVNDGGKLIVSFWSFMSVDSIARQAEEITDAALTELGIGIDDLESQDYFLGWQNSETARRYCHNFVEAEVLQLAEDAEIKNCELFAADGRNGKLNIYLIASNSNNA